MFKIHYQALVKLPISLAPAQHSYQYFSLLEAVSSLRISLPLKSSQVVAISSIALFPQKPGWQGERLAEVSGEGSCSSGVSGIVTRPVAKVMLRPCSLSLLLPKISWF